MNIEEVDNIVIKWLLKRPSFLTRKKETKELFSKDSIGLVETFDDDELYE